MVSDEQVHELEENFDHDFITARDEHRFRVNMSYSQGTLGAVIRVLNHRPMPLSSIGLPPVVEEIAYRDKGLVLVTGTTSQGKITTLAALVDHINEFRNDY
ncbi:MAG: hypothetical protein CMQ05_13515 [Gammaproteobacteria bacterium]|nr:hypothetical protein [Gammaproteobacteria bacterium]RPG23829.1 MAG: hypothetical protein CBC10_013140 [Gammaproteobacteria bacterium TMED50]|tara:strand:- start:226 stop:528 length:303 start_codon:yes stop_codon:yes gene_type:complete